MRIRLLAEWGPRREGEVLPVGAEGVDRVRAAALLSRGLAEQVDESAGNHVADAGKMIEAPRRRRGANHG